MSNIAAGFEPAISCAQSRRQSQAFPRPEGQSVQRELNPHLLHGKQVRYLYAMNAWLEAELSKIKSTGRDSNPRRRITGAVSSPLARPVRFFSGTGGYRTHIVRFKRPVHYPVCHSERISRRGGS